MRETEFQPVFILVGDGEVGVVQSEAGGEIERHKCLSQQIGPHPDGVECNGKVSQERECLLPQTSLDYVVRMVVKVDGADEQRPIQGEEESLGVEKCK